MEDERFVAIAFDLINIVHSAPKRSIAIAAILSYLEPLSDEERARVIQYCVQLLWTLVRNHFIGSSYSNRHEQTQ